MSIIIRLQNLPWSANALDIRQYFQGLSIPEGGVHIVGGELGDAFIAFSTDEDARQAFLRNNGKIKEIQITLMLSSRTEMQRVIEQARSTSFAAFSAQPAAQVAPAAPQPLPAAVPPVARAQSPDSDRERKKQGKRRSRSRSKSRERDRSRERKSRRYRERSRSRDRSDRRDRRRRERSRSRGRSRSRDKSTRRSKDNIDRSKELKQRPEVWANPQPANPTDVLVGKGLLGNFPSVAAKVTLDALQGLLPRRDSNWSPPQGLNNGRGGFIRNNKSRFDNNSASKFETMEIDDDEEDTRDCCIKLEPFYGNYTDLRKFFTGLHISYKGIKMINDDSGHRTGVCYIKFYNAKFKHDAVERNGRDLNGISVKIQHLDDEIFEKSVDKYKPHYDPQDNSNNTYNHPRHKNITKYFNNRNGMSDIDSDIKDFTCLKVEELPNYAKEQDILHMFSLHPLLALHLTPRGRGGTGHIAYVKFSSSDVAIQALNERQQHVVGGKTVLVRPCADDEFEAISRERDVDLEVKRESTPPITTECLELTRLPQKTNDRDISDFFSDIGLIPTKIHLISNNSGFTGTAYCEFDSIEEANNAVKKDGSTIGTATVSVKPISKNDMEATLKSTLTIPAVNTIIPPPSIQQQPSVILPPPPIIQPLVPTLTAPLRLFPPQRMPFAQARGRGRGAPFNQRGVGMRPPRYAPGPPGGAGNGEEAPPGCTVYMDNVPYKAGTNEILEFFEGYNCTNNVSRRYNPNNTPSAEAKVTFFSPEEAARAVEELHGQKIWERSIFLTQV